MKKLIAIICLVLTFLLAMGGCAAPVAEMDMQAVYEEITQEIQMPQMLVLDESLMLDYCGIRKEAVNQAVVMICADSLRTDEIWLLEAVDAAAAKDLMELADKRLGKKGEESITYSPEQYKVVEKAKCLQAGNYIALFVSPDSEAMAKVFQKAAT